MNPIDQHMFYQVLQRVEKLLASRASKHIILPTEDGFTHIDTADVLYVETGNHVLLVHTKDETYTIRDSIKNMGNQLAGCAFFRCNNGYFITLKHVGKVASHNVIVGGQILAISRPRYKAFMEAFTKYIGGSHA